MTVTTENAALIYSVTAIILLTIGELVSFFGGMDLATVAELNDDCA